jgi:transcriptional regulator with GAF, ATPase, and Fis domain
VHTLSQRRGAFVAVNCGAIAQNLLEAELFGYRKGAFSGALENRPGLVRAADGGTLLLDEIGDLPAASQAALLRVLQEGEVLAVGATEPVKVDVRVLAATHADLEALVTTGKFRADLLARIAGFTVRLPPLRWRREDLGLLIGSFLRKFGRDDASFTCEAGRALLGYRWPANIRELEKAIESALVLAGEGPIDVQHLPGLKEQIRGIVPRRYPAELSPEDERHRDELAGLLRQNHGNVAAVARAMGKARMQIHRWVRRYDLRLSDFR